MAFLLMVWLIRQVSRWSRVPQRCIDCSSEGERRHAEMFMARTRHVQFAPDRRTRPLLKPLQHATPPAPRLYAFMLGQNQIILRYTALHFSPRFFSCRQAVMLVPERFQHAAKANPCGVHACTHEGDVPEQRGHALTNKDPVTLPPADHHHYSYYNSDELAY
jgi:hypothetical protein